MREEVGPLGTLLHQSLESWFNRLLGWHGGYVWAAGGGPLAAAFAELPTGVWGPFTQRSVVAGRLLHTQAHT